MPGGEFEASVLCSRPWIAPWTGPFYQQPARRSSNARASKSRSCSA